MEELSDSTRHQCTGESAVNRTKSRCRRPEEPWHPRRWRHWTPSTPQGRPSVSTRPPGTFRRRAEKLKRRRRRRLGRGHPPRRSRRLHRRPSLLFQHLERGLRAHLHRWHQLANSGAVAPVGGQFGRIHQTTRLYKRRYMRTLPRSDPRSNDSTTHNSPQHVLGKRILPARRALCKAKRPSHAPHRKFEDVFPSIARITDH